MNTSRILTVVTMLSIFLGSLLAAAQTDFSTTPTKKNGERWQIGYYEGGEYIEYQKVLIATINSLMELGWISNTNIPQQKGEQTDQLWHWLATSVQSEYLEFVKDAHYSNNWDDENKASMANAVIDRLNKQGDIDLIIAMGTWAGQGLANDNHNTATVVLSSSDPLSSGIIQSTEDSGYKHLHATVDPNRYERQLRVFHDIVNFRRLGVAYENSTSGRSYAAMEVVESLSKEVGFEIVRCFTKSDISMTAEAEKSVIDCFDTLGQTADAIYVTEQGGITQRSLPALVQSANKHNVPTFSQSGATEVKYGVLASLSQSGYKYFGDFHAQTFAKIFNGASPGQLEQVFEEPPKMAINLKTAEQIGFNPSLLLLGASDEIYEEIAIPQ